MTASSTLTEEARPGSAGTNLRRHTMSAFTDFTMDSITGESVSFDRYKGQVSLIVNVASA